MEPKNEATLRAYSMQELNLRSIMRNAVIRKKRLKAERAVDDYMRMPQRLMAPHIEISADLSHLDSEAMMRSLISERLWAHSV